LHFDLTQSNTYLTVHFVLATTLSDGDVDDLEPNVLERQLLTAGDKGMRYSFTNRTLIGSLSLDESSYNNSERRRQAEEEEMERRRARAADAEARRKAAEEEKKKKEAEEEAKRQAAEAEVARKKAVEEEKRRNADEERMKRLQAQEEERKKQIEEQRLAFEREQAEKARKAAEKAAMTPKAALSDKKLIMLISSMSGNMTTSTNQAQAQSLLASLEVVPEIIDGADPMQKDVRNELFTLSGLRGKYPQFFLRQADGTMKFFGDFDTLAHYNDTGTLAAQIGGSATPRQSENSAPGVAPKSTLNGSKLLMLISSMSGSLEVSTNQNLMQNIVKGLYLPPEEIEIIDGCEPSVKDRRNELFGISGIRAKYPQLFLVKGDGTTLFVGNFDDISYLHDTNTLSQAIGLNSQKAAPEPTSTLNGKTLLFLISSMSGSGEVASNQTRVENIIKGLNLPPTEIEVMDGCDQSLKDRRNELFGISGIRAKYPQLFLVNDSDGTTQFVGNFEDVCYMHDNNNLALTLGLVSNTNVSAAAPAETGATNDNSKPESTPTETKSLPSPPPPSKDTFATNTAEPTTTTDVEKKLPTSTEETPRTNAADINAGKLLASSVALEKTTEPTVDVTTEPPKESTPPEQPTAEEAPAGEAEPPAETNIEEVQKPNEAAGENAAASAETAPALKAETDKPTPEAKLEQEAAEGDTPAIQDPQVTEPVLEPEEKAPAMEEGEGTLESKPEEETTGGDGSLPPDSQMAEQTVETKETGEAIPEEKAPETDQNEDTPADEAPIPQTDVEEKPALENEPTAGQNEDAPADESAPTPITPEANDEQTEVPPPAEAPTLEVAADAGNVNPVETATATEATTDPTPSQEEEMAQGAEASGVEEAENTAEGAEPVKTTGDVAADAPPEGAAAKPAATAASGVAEKSGANSEAHVPDEHIAEI